VVLALGWGWFVAAQHSSAQESEASEYAVKAAFIVSFPKYVDWPAEEFTDANSPIIIGVLGETKVTRDLQRVIAGRVVNGRELILKRLAPGEEETAIFNILFVPAEEQRRALNFLAKHKRGALTIGESDDFLESGGIICLRRRNQKISLEVNLASAGSAGIRLSSKLLGVASAVKGRSN
jgi:hypothetical protein